MRRMFQASVVLVMFSVFLFHGPLDAATSGTLATPPLQVVVVSGTNYEMGVQYGEQAAAFIAAMRDEAWNIMDNQVVDPNTGLPLGHERNLHFFEYSVLIRDRSACLFFRQPRGNNATLLPVIVSLKFRPAMRYFTWKSIKSEKSFLNFWRSNLKLLGKSLPL